MNKGIVGLAKVLAEYEAVIRKNKGTPRGKMLMRATERIEMALESGA